MRKKNNFKTSFKLQSLRYYKNNMADRTVTIKFLVFLFREAHFRICPYCPYIPVVYKNFIFFQHKNVWSL